MLVSLVLQKNLIIELAYGTCNNFTSQKIYQNSVCLLHIDAYNCLMKAFKLAQSLGFGLKIFDAFRPVEAQEKLWEIYPNAMYVADPKQGSSHNRGIAVDLTLVNTQFQEIDMATPFDLFDERSHHGCTDIPTKTQQNRLILLGIMTASGFDWYQNEWWHYQLFNPAQYALLRDKDAPLSLMTNG